MYGGIASSTRSHPQSPPSSAPARYPPPTPFRNSVVPPKRPAPSYASRPSDHSSIRYQYSQREEANPVRPLRLDLYSNLTENKDEESSHAHAGDTAKEWKGADFSYGVGFDSAPTTSSKATAKKFRRLEKEFGTISSAISAKEKEIPSMEELKMEKLRERLRMEEMSGVDSSGRLIVVGKGKRTALRVFQGLGAFGVGVGSFGTLIVSQFVADSSRC